MSYISTSEDPVAAKAVLDQMGVLLAEESATNSPPPMEAPPKKVWTLCGGVTVNGRWVRDFEVRELTGADEEALFSTSNDREFFQKILSLALVSVGGRKADPDTFKYLMAGDLETILLAIRIVSFGSTWNAGEYSCDVHGPFTVEMDLEDIPRKECAEEDQIFTVEGRKGNVYRLQIPSGNTYLKIMEDTSDNPGYANTILLSESLLDIDGQALIMPVDQVRKISWGDRRILLSAIESREIGPDLKGVTVACPVCGAEQVARISIAATFLS